MCVLVCCGYAKHVNVKYINDNAHINRSYISSHINRNKYRYAATGVVGLLVAGGVYATSDSCTVVSITNTLRMMHMLTDMSEMFAAHTEQQDTVMGHTTMSDQKENVPETSVTINRVL